MKEEEVVISEDKSLLSVSQLFLLFFYRIMISLWQKERNQPLVKRHWILS